MDHIIFWFDLARRVHDEEMLFQSGSIMIVVLVWEMMNICANAFENEFTSDLWAGLWEVRICSVCSESLLQK